MKTTHNDTLLALLSFLVCLTFNGFATLHAQDWAPLNPSEQFNYQRDGSAIITATIFDDAVTLSGVDSVYHLNRIVAPCDTCAGPHVYLLTKEPQFLMRLATRHVGGLWHLHDTANIALHTWAPQGDTWLFDSTLMVNATVDSIYADSVFAQADSIKRILLSTGDTILLTQTHGILQWPDGYGSGIYHRLVGIKGRNLGRQLPGYAGMQGYHVGDVFQFQSAGYHCEAGPCGCDGEAHRYKGTVDSLHLLGDTTIVYFHGIDVYSYLNCNQPSGGPMLIVDSFILVDSADHFMNHYPNQLISMYQRLRAHLEGIYELSVFSNMDDRYYDRCTYEDAGSGRVRMKSYFTQRYGYFPYVTPSSPVLWDNGEFVIDSIQYLEGVGLERFDWGGFESYGYWHLEGYFDGTDTTGVLTSDSVLLMLGTTSPKLVSLQVAPNPSSGIVVLSWKRDGSGDNCVLEVYSIAGTRVAAVVVPGTMEGRQQIDLQSLDRGLYFYRLRDVANVLGSGKLVIR